MNAPNQGAAPAPMNDEERFAEVAESVDNTRDQERQQREQQREQPRQPEPGAGDRGAAPNGDGQQPSRVRDEGGRFAPAPEPFVGFKDLPKEQQDYIRNLQRTADRATNGYATTQRELEALRRTRPATPPPTKPAPQPAAKPESSQQPPAKPALPKWEARSKEFPDDYASIEERVAAAEAELGRNLTAQETRIAKLEQQLQEQGKITSQYQADKAVEHRTRTRGYLDEISPQWRYTAGWEDENGNAIPKGQQQYRPEFNAWLQAQPPKLRAVLQAQLDHDDPELIGDVFQRFDRDYAAVLAWQEQHGQGAPQRGNPQPTPQRQPQNRRQAALSDVQPRPGSGGSAPRVDPPVTEGPAFDREEAAFDAATTPANVGRWRGQR